MKNRRTTATTLQTSWDRILGTRSHVRVLRVLEQTRESMAVRDLARRAGEHLRAVQLGVQRLVEAGVVERVGSGTQQQVRLSERHPLAVGLKQLFEAERARFDRILEQLKSLAKKYAPQTTAVWLREGTLPDGTGLEVNLLAPSGEVDALTDGFRKEAAGLMRNEDVPIEVRGWTRPDLEAIGTAILSGGGQRVLLGGILPEKLEAGGGPIAPRSHLAADEVLLDRARRVAVVLKRRPELIRHALSEVRKRLHTAQPSMAKTLQEWEQVLDGMSIPRLQKWLVGRTERATRLRQSMPLVFLQATEEPSEKRKTS